MSGKLPDFAKVAPTFAHAPLFRCLLKGERTKQKLDVLYSLEGGRETRFIGFEPLDVTDYQVLLGLAALATQTLNQRARGVRKLLRDGRLERPGLKLGGAALDQRVIGVRFNLAELGQIVGYAEMGGSQRRILRDSILRMSNVTVLVSQDGREATYRLLSGYGLDTETGDVLVGLNPTIANAVLGKDGYLRVSLREMRLLKTDAARLLHRCLHWINPGRAREVGMDKLCAYVYGETTVSSDTAKKRKKAIRSALGRVNTNREGHQPPAQN